MAKGKSGKTFFEVYGTQPHGGHSSSGSKAGEEKIPEDFPYYEGENIIVVSDIADKLHTKEGGPGKGRAVIIIVAIVCGVGLAVGMFFLGRSVGTVKAPTAVGTALPKAEGGRGKGPERPEAVAPTPRKPIVEKPAPEKPPAMIAVAPPVAPPPPVTPPPAAPPKSKDTWALRIISYSDVQKNLEKAAAVADFLQSATGHDAFVARLGDKLVVCLGEFDSQDNPELLELQKEVREFEYENKKQFVSSYPVRIK